MIRRKKTKPQEHKNYEEHKKKTDAEALKRLKTETPYNWFRYNGEIEITLNLEALANKYDHEACHLILSDSQLTIMIREALLSVVDSVGEKPTCRLGGENNNTFHIKEQVDITSFFKAETTTEVLKKIQEDYLDIRVVDKIINSCQDAVKHLTPEQYRKDIPHLKAPEDITVTLTQPEKLVKTQATRNGEASSRINELLLNRTTC